MCFLKFAFFCKKFQKLHFSKIVLVSGNLPPPGRHQIGSGNLRYLVFFEIRIFLQKVQKIAFFKNRIGIWKFAASGTATNWQRESALSCVSKLIRTGLATSWHHFTWPPPQHPATQRAQQASLQKNANFKQHPTAQIRAANLMPSQRRQISRYQYDF